MHYYYVNTMSTRWLGPYDARLVFELRPRRTYAVDHKKVYYAWAWHDDTQHGRS